MKLVKTINSGHSSSVAKTLRDLADLAERDELIGVAVAGLCRQKRPVAWLSGLCKIDISLAAYTVGKLFYSLMMKPLKK